MKKPNKVLLVSIMVLFIVALAGVSYAAVLKNFVPEPVFNPTTREKIVLGEKLFFDSNLSNPPGVSCATCHDPEFGFAEDERVSTGVFGRQGTRNAPTAFASAVYDFQFWDGRAASLESQALGPVINPVEMNNSWDNVIDYLSREPDYVAMFNNVFDGEITTTNIAKAIAAYERTLLPQNTAYQRYVKGEKNALNASAKRGMDLFFGKANCSECHPTPFFTDSDFHNLGVPQIYNIEAPDLGRYDVTSAEDDKCKFKTPTLFNVALTAPYMHDGSIDTLYEVVEFYDDADKRAPAGELSHDIKPLGLSDPEIKDLVAFLESLTEKPMKK